MALVVGIWERVYNRDFNYGEFAIIKSQAGLNNYKISVKEWVAKTNAIGLRAAAGGYMAGRLPIKTSHFNSACGLVLNLRFTLSESFSG